MIFIKLLKKDSEILILLLLMFIPSLRAVFKYLPMPEVLSIILGLFLLVFYVILLKIKKTLQILSKPIFLWIIPIIISIFIVANYFIYPIADARKNIGMGSTADDAIIVSVNQFISKGKMYDATVYGGAPISPGPGWILMNSPFVISNCYFLLTPVYVAVSIVLFLLLFKKRIVPVVLLLLLSSSLIFWELMVTGHDLIALGLSFSLISMLLYHYCIKLHVVKLSLSLVLISVLIGFISTSRIIFIFLPFIIIVLFFKFNPKQAIQVFLISFLTTILLHSSFYFLNDFYQPLHLLNRGKNNVGFPIISLGAVITLLFAMMASIKVQKSFDSILGWFSILVITPLFFISFGEFVSIDFNLAVWEGANYIVPVIPMYLFYICVKLEVDKKPKIQQRAQVDG